MLSNYLVELIGRCWRRMPAAWIAVLIALMLSCPASAGAEQPAANSSGAAKEKQPISITFPADGPLTVSADFYAYTEHPKESPFILLFHQAGWSRGEYRETAAKLNRLGFNCLAVDLRSGKEVNGVVNQTAARAEKAGRPQEYGDALPDIFAAIRLVEDQFRPETIILLGSSYSASLVLKAAAERPDAVDGVAAFSPGEYFKGKAEHWIRDSVGDLQLPVFITSARSEKPQWQEIYEAIPADKKMSYLPKKQGAHGSRALWRSSAGHEGYWKALEGFLSQFIADAEKPT